MRAFYNNYHKSERRLDKTFSHMSPDLEKQRQTASRTTFLVVTLLFALLLMAPAEHDIILTNPFYAAVARVFTASPSSSLLLMAGERTLRTAKFVRHQRVLDAPLVPPTDVNPQSIPVVSDKVQRSNIVSIQYPFRLG